MREKMINETIIYWFSGTGNSLYAAKHLADELGDTSLVQITEEPPIGKVGGKGEKIGFVFPSYYLHVPRAVKAFVDKLEIKQGTYIFSIVTMGAIGHGSIVALDRILKNKALRLNYGKGLKMPDNYILLYNPHASNESGKLLDKCDKSVKRFAADIKAEKQSVTRLPITLKTMYKNVESLDTKFTVKDNCNSCGICEKKCPVSNIKFENDKPVWLHHCEHCVACISWCPVHAIEYGDKTQKRNRYCNPRIKVNELMR
jgi:ferredoxin